MNNVSNEVSNEKVSNKRIGVTREGVIKVAVPRTCLDCKFCIDNGSNIVKSKQGGKEMGTCTCFITKYTLPREVCIKCRCIGCPIEG